MLKDGEADAEEQKRWAREAVLIGLLAIILGLAPTWAINRQIYTAHLWDSRLGMASMYGAALMVAGILEWLIQDEKNRLILLCVLIGLSVGWNLRVENDYRWSWTKQNRFYWQLRWRAPYIEPETAILSDGELFNYMGRYPTSFAINTIYPKHPETPELVNYWFFTINKDFDYRMEAFLNGMELEGSRYASTFTGHSEDSLVIFYEPYDYRCLWVLGPDDGLNPDLPDVTRESLHLSDLDRIMRDSPLEEPMPSDIFGSEPDLGWCYYYQKGDLAGQYKDWDEVVRLWEEAEGQELRPKNGLEFIPFIEGYAYNGEWETAKQMTERSNQLTAMMHPILCQTWAEIEEGTNSTQERDAALLDIRENLGCSQ
jgi:hypothetical protein